VETQLKTPATDKATDKTGDKAMAKVTKELDKFWKFQTKSVAELIESIGGVEEKQEKTFADFKKDLGKSIGAWKPDIDLKLVEEVKGDVEKLCKSVESRDDGIDNFSTTISELALNIDDTLKVLQKKHDSLTKRIEKMEESLTKFPKAGGGQDVSNEIKSLDERFKGRLDDIVGAHKRIEDSLETWRETMGKLVDEFGERQNSWKNHFDEIEKKQAEVIDLVQKGKGGLDDEKIAFKTKEAKKFNNLGVTSFHNGEFELARDQFLEAVQLDPKFAESWNNLGLVYTELQDEDGAKDAFSKAIGINPDLPASYNNLGYIYYKQGNYDRAIEMYDEALERSPDNSSAYTNLGNAHFQQSNREDARKAWEKALEIDPGNEKASRNLKRLDKK
jgi:tetratricopeptide (TPR) repeat protein